MTDELFPFHLSEPGPRPKQEEPEAWQRYLEERVPDQTSALRGPQA